MTTSYTNYGVDWMALFAQLDGESDVDAFVRATQLGDQIRDEIQGALANYRRRRLVEARRLLIEEAGLTATFAEQKLAELAGVSPSTVRRMFAERNLYGTEETSATETP